MSTMSQLIQEAATWDWASIILGGIAVGSAIAGFVQGIRAKDRDAARRAASESADAMIAAIELWSRETGNSIQAARLKEVVSYVAQYTGAEAHDLRSRVQEVVSDIESGKAFEEHSQTSKARKAAEMVLTREERKKKAAKAAKKKGGA